MRCRSSSLMPTPAGVGDGPAIGAAALLRRDSLHDGGDLSPGAVVFDAVAVDIQKDLPQMEGAAIDIPSMDKGKYGFSGRKPRPASFSSLTGDGPPASSASPDTISAPEKLRRTFHRAKIGAGEEEDDGGVAWHLPPGLPRPVPLGRGWRPPRTMTMSSADFLPLESVFALVHRG